MKADYLTTGQVARLLGVAEHRVQTLIRFQLIRGPVMCGNRRLWSPQDVEEARAVLIERGVLPDAAKA